MTRRVRQLALPDDDPLFVGSYGGPLLLLPTKHKHGWWGCSNEAGDHVYDVEPTDYDRACEDGDFPFAVDLERDGHADGWALVLESPDPARIIDVDGVATVVRWVGAETAVGLLSLAQQVPPDAFETTGLEVEVPDGGVSLFDSSADGRNPEHMDNGIQEFALPAGRYAVERVVSVEGVVEMDDGDEEVMTQLVRFRPL